MRIFLKDVWYLAHFFKVEFESNSPWHVVRTLELPYRVYLGSIRLVEMKESYLEFTWSTS